MLDAWRGIAAITIAIYHFWPVWGGYLAVDFFFVLSGFVLSHNYLYSNAIVSTYDFVGRRLARLYPFHLFTLFAYLLVVLAIGWGIPVHPDGSLATFIQNLTLTQNIGLNPNGLSWNYPSWSISVEFWVNIFFFLLVSRSASTVFLWLIALAGLALIYFKTGHLETQATNYFGFINSGFVRGLSEFLLGVITYRIYLRRDKQAARQRSRTLMEVAALAAVLTTIFARSDKFSALDFLTPFAFMMVILVFADEAGLLSRGLMKLQYVGKISYSIYLNQIIISMLIFHLYPPLMETFLLGLCLFLTFLVVVSHFTYRYIEMPMRIVIRKAFTHG